MSQSNHSGHTYTQIYTQIYTRIQALIVISRYFTNESKLPATVTAEWSYSI